MQNIAILGLFFFICGCDRHHGYETTAEDRARWAQERAENEAVEKEAHSHSRDWIRVELSKYDGQCNHMSRSARAQIDSIASGDIPVNLDSAEKVGEGDYVLRYSVGSITKIHYIYTTSLRTCEKLIQENILK